jgi:hypothetical protein
VGGNTDNKKASARNSARFEFFCTKCQQKIILNDNSNFIDAILKHYRHLHTSYDRERRKISKWLSRQDVLNATGGRFESFGELLSYYLKHKKVFNESERKHFTSLLKDLRNLGTEKARKHYNVIALFLASKDLKMFYLTN